MPRYPMPQNEAANRKATSRRNACAANRICESALARAMTRPPSIAPTRKANSAVNERAMESPDTCAVANARNTIFPVMFAVKTCPSDRKLTASTRPVTAVIPSSAQVLSAASLALVLASLFLFEGIFDIAMFLRLRAIEGSSWVLLDGMVTLILKLMSYMRWPSPAAWAIGVLVSVSLVTSGITRVMSSLGVRKSITPGPGQTKQDDSSAKDYWSVHE
jgi:hypothetical protein